MQPAFRVYSFHAFDCALTSIQDRIWIYGTFECTALYIRNRWFKKHISGFSECVFSEWELNKRRRWERNSLDPLVQIYFWSVRLRNITVHLVKHLLLSDVTVLSLRTDQTVLSLTKTDPTISFQSISQIPRSPDPTTLPPSHHLGWGVGGGRGGD